MAELAINPVIQGILDGQGLAQQFRQQVLAEKQFKLRQDQLAEEKRYREDQRMQQSQQQRMGLLQAGGRVVNGGQVRDDSQQALAKAEPTTMNGVDFPGMDVRMPTYQRPAQGERTFQTRGDDGQPMRFELPTNDEMRARQQQDTVNAFRLKIAEEVGREKMLGPVKASNAGMTEKAKAEATAIDPQMFSEAFAGNIVPGMKINKQLGDAIVTGARLRADTSRQNADRTSRETTARDNRTAADQRAAATRTNSLSIAGIREGGANARASQRTAADEAKARQQQAAEKRAQVAFANRQIASAEKEINNLQGRMATLDPSGEQWKARRADLSRLVREKNDLYRQRDQMNDQKQAEDYNPQ